MITKAKIVDIIGNKCIVQIPLFNSAAGGDIATAEATFSNTPGIFNGYKINDIVLIAFEDGLLQQPVVIGKLYLGVEEEIKTPRGAINCEDLKTSNSNMLPLSTKIEANNPDTKISVTGAPTSYVTLKEVLESIQNNTQTISILDNKIINTEYVSLLPEISITSMSSGYVTSETPFSIRLLIKNPEKLAINDEMTVCIYKRAYRLNNLGEKIRQRYRLQSLYTYLITENDLKTIKKTNEFQLKLDTSALSKLAIYSRVSWKNYAELNNQPQSAFGSINLYIRIRRETKKSGKNRNDFNFSNTVLLPIRLYSRPNESKTAYIPNEYIITRGD